MNVMRTIDVGRAQAATMDVVAGRMTMITAATMNDVRMTATRMIAEDGKASGCRDDGRHYRAKDDYRRDERRDDRYDDRRPPGPRREEQRIHRATSGRDLVVEEMQSALRLPDPCVEVDAGT
eukprot:Skav200960  [mRNA]  locus=scaffold448:360526:368576:- [translate_table: standard]